MQTAEELKTLVGKIFVPTRLGIRKYAMNPRTFFLIVGVKEHGGPKPHTPKLLVWKLQRDPNKGIQHPAFKKAFRTVDRKMFTVQSRLAKPVPFMPDERVRLSMAEDGLNWKN